MTRFEGRSKVGLGCCLRFGRDVPFVPFIIVL
jgi:hypothetical protein